MPGEAKDGSRFVVDLGALRLPQEAEKRVASEIRQVVMREIAGLDFKGDVVIAPTWTLDRRWWGIWIDVASEALDLKAKEAALDKIR